MIKRFVKMTRKARWSTIIGIFVAGVLAAYLMLAPRTLDPMLVRSFTHQMQYFQVIRFVVIILLWSFFWEPISRFVEARSDRVSMKDLVAYRYRFLIWYLVIEGTIVLGLYF